MNAVSNVIDGPVTWFRGLFFSYNFRFLQKQGQSWSHLMHLESFSNADHNQQSDVNHRHDRLINETQLRNIFSIHRKSCHAESKEVPVVPREVPSCPDHRPVRDRGPGMHIRGQPAVQARSPRRRPHSRGSSHEIRGLHALRGAGSHGEVQAADGDLSKSC